MNEELKKFCTALPSARRVAIWFAVLVSLLYALIFSPPVRTSQNWTCLFCRAHRDVTTFLERKSDTIAETDFSAWYQQNRPVHEHRWVRTGPRIKYNIFGIPAGSGCGIYHPVCNLPQQWQLEFVQSAKPEEIEAFFAGILSTNRSEQRGAVKTVFDPIWERHVRERK